MWLAPFALVLAAMQGASTAPPSFADWLAAYAPRARAAGVSQATIERELDGLVFSDRVVALDRAQPDDSRGGPPRFDAYLARQVPGRVASGSARATELQPILTAIERRYGVPGPVVVAIWGLESGYGAVTGGFDLVQSLASLAFEGRRAALFERELTAALTLIDQGRVGRDTLRGSWAGATGQPQFLPSSYVAHAVDGDGDGRADIWSSRADTLASIANYLAQSGWRAGGRWGDAVEVPATLERWRVRALTTPATCMRPLARHSRWLRVAEWRALGLRPVDGAWPSNDTLATLIEPDGEGQGAFLTYGNYRAILGYNCSNFYALSVGLLADRL